MLGSERTVEEERNDDPLIGATLGGLYQVESLIGVGGMGRVYRAVHARLGKAYAVKVLPEERSDSRKAVERFLREARSASKIDHEHIVKVVNCDSDAEHRLFIVMELLQGENLGERLDRGALPLEDAIEIARQTGSALQAAHDAGIVHRDLKPENIFITQRHGKDFVKLLDFGISKIKTPEHDDLKLTATDQIIGTPLYIAPELARGVQEVDNRTDIYALGVIVYEMLTGTPPFTGDNHFQLLYKHGNEAPEPPSQRSRKADIPAHVESAVLRALEKEPDDRFDSMSGFVAALEGPTVPRRARTVGIPLLIAAVSAALAFLIWPFAEPTGTEPQDGTVQTPPTTSPTSPPAVTEKSELPAQTFDAEAVPALARLELDSRPSGAIVALDGEKMGKTPLSVELERGAEVTVRFSLPGYRSERRRLVAGEEDTLVVRLKKRAAPPTKPSPIKTEF